MWLFGKKKESERKLSPEQEQVQAFARRFEAQEMTLVAVTGMQGASHTRENEDELWTVRVPLTAWMDAFDAVVHHQPASLEILADDRLLGYLLQRLPRNFILKAKVRPALEGDAFQLVDMPEPGFDPELKAILDEQVKPVVLDGGALGKFTLNRAMNWFEAQVDYLGQPVLLAFEQDNDRQDCLATARAMLADAEGWDTRLRNYVADRFLDLLNEQAEEAITRDELVEGIDHDTIIAGPGGSFTVWYSGAPFFEAVWLTGTLEAGPTDAGLDE